MNNLTVYKTSPAKSMAARVRRQASVLVLSGLLTACASTGGQSPNMAANSSVPGMDQPPVALGDTPEDQFAQMAYWGSIYEANPSSVDAALNYGRSLRYVERTKQAVTVLSRAVVLDPENPETLSEYGKALVEVGRVMEGADYLSRASSRRPNHWPTLTAEAVALDQLGNHKAAQSKYNAALAASPGNPTVLNNLALSLALSGDINQAEVMLRQAVREPQASAQMRQNLALILGLKGNFVEARQYASADLPPAAVENNLAYIRSMLGSGKTPWSDLKQID